MLKGKKIEDHRISGTIESRLLDVNMNLEIATSVKRLEKYVSSQKYSGYDPYDALNSEKLNNINLKFLRVFFTQLFVYSPINSRLFFNVNQGINAKALGLFLSSYCNLFKIGFINHNSFENISSKLVNLLLNNASLDFSGYCWGFNFNWQDTKRNAKKFTPTIVVTSYIGNSFLDLYEITHKQKYLDIAESITNFIIKDLHIRKCKNGICFSYTPIDKHIVHNANCLGAAFLSRVYKTNKDEKLLDYSRKAFDYSISRQNKNGSWEFQLFPESGKVRNQTDFHQGFILDSLMDFIKYIGENDKKYKQSLLKGSDFYINEQFEDFGRSKWRLPWSYPVDIHHQAQGIITLCKLYNSFKNDKYLEFAYKIAKWTIENMQDKIGYFYYQKWPFLTNKIPYMRWGQAWMMLALSSLLYVKKEDY